GGGGGPGRRGGGALRAGQPAVRPRGRGRRRALPGGRVAGLVGAPPALVLLTGDFLTMEGSGSRGALAAALRPLEPLAGRTFAIFGNHDHEAADEGAHALAENCIRLPIGGEAGGTTPVRPGPAVGAARGRGE